MNKQDALHDLSYTLGKHVKLIDYAEMKESDIKIFITTDETALPARMGEGSQTTKRISLYWGEHQKWQGILETTTTRKEPDESRRT